MNWRSWLQIKSLWVGLSMATVALPALGSGNAADDIGRRDQKVMSTRTFLNAHPDLKYRYEGWVAYEAGDYGQALDHFRMASRYADKASQAMVAEMLWQGRGVPVNHALAYAWADLAAERGYVRFVRLREQYWRVLDVAERERSIREGRPLLEEYADAVARPRIDAFLAKAARRDYRSGVSVGKPWEVRVVGPGGSMMSIPGHRFYAPKYWDPVQYQAWQDEIWAAPPKGQVDVGDVEQVAPAKE
ncbi:MAG: sel1 repeat family protein [Pseudoxanthomonas sp.]